MADFMVRNIDGAVWAAVKQRAAREGRSLRYVVETLVGSYALFGLPDDAVATARLADLTATRERARVRRAVTARVNGTKGGRPRKEQAQ